MNFALLKDLPASSFAIALRSLVNLSYGTLIAISRERARNFLATGNPDVRADSPGTPGQGALAGGAPTDLARGVQSHREAGMAEDHTEEVGHERPLTPTQRGNLYASLAASCFEQADERGINPASFDYPLSFDQYIDNRITRMRSQVPTKFEIQAHAHALMIEEDEAEQLLIEGYAKNAENLKNETGLLISSMSDYEATADEDVFDRFPLLDQYRMFVKVIDSLCYEADRLKKPITQYGTPGRANQFTDDLLAKRFELVDDALILSNKLKEFHNQYRDKLASAIAGTDRELPSVAPSNHRMMSLVLRQRRIDAETRMEIEAEKARKLKAGSLDLSPADTKPMTAGQGERHIIDQRSRLGR